MTLFPATCDDCTVNLYIKINLLTDAIRILSQSDAWPGKHFRSQVTYDFDFAKYDQRLAANVFFGLANAEKRDNIANFRYTLPDGTIDKLEQGVPRSWDTFSRSLSHGKVAKCYKFKFQQVLSFKFQHSQKSLDFGSFQGMPKQGTFHFTYKCAPEDRKFALRKALLGQYGKWKVDVSEGEVTWWAAANEAPEDVLEFLFWMRLGGHVLSLEGGDNMTLETCSWKSRKRKGVALSSSSCLRMSLRREFWYVTHWCYDFATTSPPVPKNHGTTFHSSRMFSDVGV